MSTAVLPCTISASQARAVPLDKLTGGRRDCRGSFIGMGPSAVDVQAIVPTDNTAAEIGARLRFTPVNGKGVNPLVQCVT